MPFPSVAPEKVAGGSLPQQVVDESCLVHYVCKETAKDLLMSACPEDTRREGFTTEENGVGALAPWLSAKTGTSTSFFN